MNISKDALESRFAEAPEEIKNLLGSGKFGNDFDAIALKWKLGDEEKAFLIEQIALFFLKIETQTGFRDNLSNRLNITQEVADEIVQTVIALATEFLAQEPSKSVLPFACSFPPIRITSKVVQHGATSYSIRTVSEVSAVELRFPFSDFCINAGLTVLVGIPLLFSFSYWSILGIIIIAVCGYLAKSCFKKDYVATINFLNGEEIFIHTSKRDVAFGIRDAVLAALATKE